MYLSAYITPVYKILADLFSTLYVAVPDRQTIKCKCVYTYNTSLCNSFIAIFGLAFLAI